MSKLLNVAAIQHACGHNKDKNLAISTEQIRIAAARGANLVVLPELHATQYFCLTQDNAHFNLAEPIPGPSVNALAKLAAELNIVIVGSIFERRAAGIYHNTAVVLDTDGRLAGKYRKMHIPDDPGYNEKFYFTPGDLGFLPVSTSLGVLGILICWDQWFPEAARIMALAGADLLIYPTAIGWDPHDQAEEQQRQLDAWLTIQRAHAIANGLPLISCNRIGQESDTGNTFWGNSFIAGPQGELLARADTTADIVEAQLDMKAIEQVRQTWPYLRDRRIDAYQQILNRWNA